MALPLCRIPLASVSGSNPLDGAAWDRMGAAEVQQLQEWMQQHGQTLLLEEVSWWASGGLQPGGGCPSDHALGPAPHLLCRLQQLPGDDVLRCAGMRNMDSRHQQSGQSTCRCCWRSWLTQAASPA